MKIEFTFNTAAIEKQGYKVQDIHNIIKKNFEKKGLPCVSEDDVLAFSDKGGKYDFSNMWNIITALMNTKWFKNFSTSCYWYNDDDAEAEDILAQSWKFEQRGFV